MNRVKRIPYPNMIDLARTISMLPKVEGLSMTTNGFLLVPMA
ncbi:hypothetical protein RINTHH_18040 [Richelia intracellularis HH01]|uniref:Uncharacterized protein n=1 Tax=Richelia intracellularis HH01 TaxID=1165094 RepID=M1WTA2_9NOST|nr:hypothetical protein [Richelia intracellularis]CCH67959.1 hypothetical protein RINTHH_18040 [Richelia intracellularis HH01]